MGKKALVRIEEGAQAISTTVGCAELLDAGLEQQLGPATAEEAALASGGGLALRVARRMGILQRRFKSAKDGLARVRDELRRWRRRRDRAMDELYGKAKYLRQGCRDLYGKKRADEFLGLRGSLAREPGDLHEQIGPLVGRLADAEWPEPAYDNWGITFKRKEAVEGLAKRWGELGTALAAMEEGEAREKVAQMVKDRAEKEYEAFRGKGTRYLAASLELAGLDELAAAVRPGAGRPGRPRKAELAAQAPRPELPAASAGGSAAAKLPAEASADSPEPPEDDGNG